MTIETVSLAQRVREGVIAAINALNEVIGVVNNRPIIYTGRQNFPGSITANSYMDVRVDFPEGTFTDAPTVIPILTSSSTQTKMGSVCVTMTETSADHFTCRAFNASDAQFLPVLRYVAIQI